MKKILIVKLGAIGDVIMALPMLDEITRVYGNAAVSWIVGKGAAPILQEFPLQKIICVDEKKLLSGTIREKIVAVFQVWREVAFQRYDFILIGYSNPKYRVLTFLTSGMRRMFHRGEGSRLFPVPGRHFIDEFRGLVHGDDCLLDLVPSARLSVPLTEDLSNAMRVLKGQPIVALAPGGAKNVLADDKVRRWPIEHYALLAELLLKNGVKVVLTGAKTDLWVQPYFSKLPIVDFIGKTNILELVGLFQKCDLVITHDSGPMHLAGLAGVGIIALFGPTNPYEKVPRIPNVRILWDANHYACCPCYDGRCYADCRDNICLRNISPERVYQETAAMLCLQADSGRSWMGE